MMMSLVTEKPSHWELSSGGVVESKFLIVLSGEGWGDVGALAGYRCDYFMKLEPSFCTNEQTKVAAMVEGF